LVRKFVVRSSNWPRAGTAVKQLSVTFGVSQASLYTWLEQDRIDRGELPGLNTGQQFESAVAKSRIKQLETELAVSRKVNEVFFNEDHPKGSAR